MLSLSPESPASLPVRWREMWVCLSLFIFSIRRFDLHAATLLPVDFVRRPAHRPVQLNMFYSLFVSCKVHFHLGFQQKKQSYNC